MLTALAFFAATTLPATTLPAATLPAAGPPAPLPLPVESEARRVIDAQLASPPRPGLDRGLSPAEAEAVTAFYLRSIGQPLPAGGTTGGRSAGTGGAQARGRLP